MSTTFVEDQINKKISELTSLMHEHGTACAFGDDIVARRLLNKIYRCQDRIEELISGSLDHREKEATHVN